MPPEPPAAHRLQQAADAGLEAVAERHRPAGAPIRHAAVGGVLPAEPEAGRGARPAEPEEKTSGGARGRSQQPGGVGQRESGEKNGRSGRFG